MKNANKDNLVRQEKEYLNKIRKEIGSSDMIKKSQENKIGELEMQLEMNSVLMKQLEKQSEDTNSSLKLLSTEFECKNRKLDDAKSENESLQG